MSLLRWLTLTAVVVAAFWLRTHDLENRPMHADEANQAVKLGELIESGSYAFDPRDHHGPTLYYAGAVVARVRGERTLAQLTERTVRLVPAGFGTLSVLLIAALLTLARPAPGAGEFAGMSPRNGYGPTWPAIAAAAFVAVSPASVYYSRYFVQETLLVTFTLAGLAAALAWWRRGYLGWAIAAGGFAGLMQATKASAPLFLACAAIAALVASALRGRARPPGGPSGNQTILRDAPKSPPGGRTLPATNRAPGGDGMAAPHRRWRSAISAAVIATAVTAALLYSSFGTNLSGLRDAFAAYSHALTRFGAESGPTGHEKAWWYYLRMFGWYREGGLLWHQVAFSALAVSGFGLALKRWRHDAFSTWAAVYALLVAGAFSLFAYKTPWHVVHFIPGFALLAAIALGALGRIRGGWMIATAFAAITIGTLYQQTQRAAFLRPSDQRNPYAYVHSTPDVRKYRAAAEAARAVAPTQPIRVISDEYWPLPWYLRGIPNVGYYATPPESVDGALVIVAATQADAVRAQLRGRYQETFLGLRPGVICILFALEP